MGRRSLGQSADDTPLARWLVALAERRGWTSGRQAATYAGVNPSAFAAWLRGVSDPDRLSQERLAEAAGVPLSEVADLVYRTKSQKQRLTVGDLKRIRAQEEEEAPPADLAERLERIERRLEGIERIERRLDEGLSEMEIRAIVDEFFRRRDQGTLPETYLDDPEAPEDASEDELREAVG